MSTPKIGRTLQTLTIEQTRSRQTPKPHLTFTKVLQGGANILLAGAQGASTLVGSPLLSAAVSRAKAGTDLIGGNQPSQGDPAQVLQQARFNDELKLLAIQDEIQRRDRQISLISNVMKAKHDTAKSTIGNIRS